jgi:hypothetical protein
MKHEISSHVAVYVYTAFPVRSECFLNRLKTFVICVLYSNQITTPRTCTKDSGIIVVLV